MGLTYRMMRKSERMQNKKKVNFRDGAKVGLVNNLCSSLFKTVDLYLNNAKVTQSNDVYAYIAVSSIAWQCWHAC